MGQDFHVNLSEELASTPCDHWGGDMFRDPEILSKVDGDPCEIVQRFFLPHDSTAAVTDIYLPSIAPRRPSFMNLFLQAFI